MSSFWWNFHHWLHWKLSKWQLPVQPVIKISSKWRHFRFSDIARLYISPWVCAIHLFICRYNDFQTSCHFQYVTCYMYLDGEWDLHMIYLEVHLNNHLYILARDNYFYDMYRSFLRCGFVLWSDDVRASVWSRGGGRHGSCTLRTYAPWQVRQDGLRLRGLLWVSPETDGRPVFGTADMCHPDSRHRTRRDEAVSAGIQNLPGGELHLCSR